MPSGKPYSFHEKNPEISSYLLSDKTGVSPSYLFKWTKIKPKKSRAISNKKEILIKDEPYMNGKSGNAAKTENIGINLVEVYCI